MLCRLMPSAIEVALSCCNKQTFWISGDAFPSSQPCLLVNVEKISVIGLVFAISDNGFYILTVAGKDFKKTEYQKFITLVTEED